MKLDIIQRILIFSVLPKEGTLLTMKTLKQLKDKVIFSEEEIKKFNLRIEDNKYLWDLDKNEPVDIEITEEESKLVVEGIKDLDKQGKITEDFLELCELFNIK